MQKPDSPATLSPWQNDGAAKVRMHMSIVIDGLAAGRPADGTMDTGDSEPSSRPGCTHWRESTITDADLNDAAGCFSRRSR